MGTIHRTSIGIAISLALVLTSVGTATAKDTAVSSLYQIDAKIAQALDKKKMKLTQQVREEFAGKTTDKIRRWAKARKLDEKSFLNVVYQCQVLAVDDVAPKHAWLIVNGCNVAGLVGLKGAGKEWLTKCVGEANDKHKVIRRSPDLEKVTAWVTGAATADQVEEKVVMAHVVLLTAFKHHHEKTRKALVKKKLVDNLAIHDALSVSGQRDKFAKRYKVPIEEVEHYAAIADLTRLKGISARWAELFYQAGVKSLVNLKTGRPDLLYQELVKANKQHGILTKDPTVERVGELIEAAKPFKQH